MRKIIWLEECHSVPFTSRNLTPEENGLPAGMTFEQFKLVIRTGVDLDKAHPQFGPLLQVMPWPVYQSMTDRDLRAIYEYLSAIPPGAPRNMHRRGTVKRDSYELRAICACSQLNTSSYSSPLPWEPYLPCA